MCSRSKPEWYFFPENVERFIPEDQLIEKRRHAIDKVRASREGHEYHEAWTARKALQLLWPDSDLTAVAVEGLSPADQTRVSAVTVEVADITMYFGGNPNFEKAAKTTLAQFKYSIAGKDKDYRASNAKKTIEKFGKTYLKYKKKYGVRAVEEKIGFQLITNQPISKLLPRAQSMRWRQVYGLPHGDVEKQAKQFTRRIEALPDARSRHSRGNSRFLAAPVVFPQPRMN